MMQHFSAKKCLCLFIFVTRSMITKKINQKGVQQKHHPICKLRFKNVVIIGEYLDT